jgi:hypothetical protein
MPRRLHRPYEPLISMHTLVQLDQVLFPILLYRNDATELLVEAKLDGLHLPLVSAQAHTRIAEGTTTAIRTIWNMETYCLFSLPLDGCFKARLLYHVVEACRRDADAPTGMQWLPITSLSDVVFEDPTEYEAVQKSLAALDQYRKGQLLGTFGKLGWLRVVTEWVEAQAGAAGLSLTGKFHQLNASPTFSLLRFETDGPALWFKAVGEPNLHEYSITLKLATAFRAFLPQILGSRQEWNAWLALEAEGSELDISSSVSAWEASVENLALLQVASLGRRFELIEAGCKDLRPRLLRDLVDPFFDSMTELMERQTELSPTPLSPHELSTLALEIKKALEELETNGLANTLGNLDMNPGNVVVSDSRCTFLDWAEAYVGPPLFTFQFLLEHLRRGQRADRLQTNSLIRLYARHWNHFAGPREIATTFHLAPLLAPFAYAASGGSWRPQESIRPETARNLRSLTRRMRREAAALEESGHLCAF